MTMVVVKAIGIWCLLVVCAILNGLFREKILNPYLGQDIALPISGIILSLLILAVAWLFISFFGARKPVDYWLIGGLWLGITLAFEFLFGHYVIGKSWEEILEVFDLTRGNLFLLVLLITATAPWLVAKIKGWI